MRYLAVALRIMYEEFVDDDVPALTILADLNKPEGQTHLTSDLLLMLNHLFLEYEAMNLEETRKRMQVSASMMNSSIHMGGLLAASSTLATVFPRTQNMTDSNLLPFL